MKKRLAFLLCIILAISCLTGCHSGNNETAEADNLKKLSQVLDLQQGTIESIMVFQDGTRTEVELDNVDSDIHQLLDELVKKQKIMGVIDGGVQASLEVVEKYLMNKPIEDIEPEAFVSEALKLEDMYVVIQFSEPCTFEMNHDHYVKDVEFMLIDPQEKLVHWGKEGAFFCSVGYFS